MCTRGDGILQYACLCAWSFNFAVNMFNACAVGNHCMPKNAEGKGGTDQRGL